ncbi:MAG: RNA-directed DNA polymerase [Candidatus Riflebacteria bacterium]|nr:RNA-directed DNA polymerase [Candidatus Riflebacteria bacterium]
MGFFDWLIELLVGGPSTDRFSSPQPPPRRPPGARQSRRLDLDIEQFTPLSDSEVKKQARTLGRAWSNPWFGRRDLIPPPEDPRTLLIDRAMVGHGLLTPEELVRIHEIGLEMDKVRPDLAMAKVEAQAAVARTVEERRARKLARQQESARLKKLGAEAVAQRRATDIVYLGPGVSRGLADRRSNVEKLAAASLPVLASPADVAQALGLAVPRLRWLAFHSDAASRLHYVRFTVPKKSGGTRELSSPHRALAAAQRWVLTSVLDKVPTLPAAHGFVKGRSTVTNASVHVNRAVVVNLDLVDFFPSITFPRVRGVFQRLGYSPAAATVLALLATEAPRRTVAYAGKTFHVATGPRALPQGACTSPALSNLVARGLDARLSGIAAKLGFAYTRYADDLTFSGPDEVQNLVGYLMARVRHIAGDEGFAVNEAKTRVQRRNTAQQVTGIVVNQRPNVPRTEVRRLRAILHRAATEGLAAQNRQNHPRFAEWVQGMVAYISMVNPAQGKPLAEALARLDAKKGP